MFCRTSVSTHRYFRATCPVCAGYVGLGYDSMRNSSRRGLKLEPCSKVRGRVKIRDPDRSLWRAWRVNMLTIEKFHFLPTFLSFDSPSNVRCTNGASCMTVTTTIRHTIEALLFSVVPKTVRLDSIRPLSTLVRYLTPSWNIATISSTIQPSIFPYPAQEKVPFCPNKTLADSGKVVNTALNAHAYTQQEHNAKIYFYSAVIPCILFAYMGLPVSVSWECILTTVTERENTNTPKIAFIPTILLCVFRFCLCCCGYMQSKKQRASWSVCK